MQLASTRLGALRPVFKSALTSCVVMACGDTVCQAIQRRNASNVKHDFQRTLRFGLVGLTLHGPFFHAGFSALDRFFGTGRSLGNVLKKTATGQVTLFPTYLVAMFTYLGALEGRSVGQSLHALSVSLPALMFNGTVFWPIVNIFNFMFVPPPARMLYVNTAGLLWNAYLSFVSSNRPAAAAEAAEVATTSDSAGKKGGSGSGSGSSGAAGGAVSSRSSAGCKSGAMGGKGAADGAVVVSSRRGGPASASPAASVTMSSSAAATTITMTSRRPRRTLAAPYVVAQPSRCNLKLPTPAS